MRSERNEPEPSAGGLPPEVMAPAPQLPGVLGAPPGDTLPPAGLGAPRRGSLAPAGATGALDASLVAAILAQHRSATTLHARFLRHQAEFYDALGRVPVSPVAAPTEVEELLDPAADTWLEDHRPNLLTIVLPGAAIAERLASAAVRYTGRAVSGLRDVELRRWVTVRAPVRLRTEVSATAGEPVVTLSVWQASLHGALSRYASVATGRVVFAEPPDERPARFTPLVDARSQPVPYDSGEMFHGPSMRYLVSLRAGALGATTVLDCDRGSVPRGVLHAGLLDAAMHAFTVRNLALWGVPVQPGSFGLPQRLVSVRLFDPLPAIGLVEAETRFAGFDGTSDRPILEVQLCRGDRVLADLRVVLVLVGRGRFAAATPEQVRRYARGEDDVSELLVSTTDADSTVLRARDVAAFDFLPGTVEEAYGLAGQRNALARIAVAEHLARRLSVHPRAIEVGDDARTARSARRPGHTFRLLVESTADAVTVRSAATAAAP